VSFFFSIFYTQLSKKKFERVLSGTFQLENMAVCSLAMASVGSVVTAPALSSSSISAAKKLSSSNTAFNGCGSVQQQLAPPVKCSCASSSGRVVAVRANLSEVRFRTGIYLDLARKKRNTRVLANL
jgi:hypothetical protein